MRVPIQMKFLVILQNLPPKIILDTNQTNIITNNNIFKLTGSIEESSAVKYLKINNTAINSTDNYKSWSFSKTLNEGDNILDIETADEYNNISTKQLIIHLDTIKAVTTSSVVSGIYNTAQNISLSSNEADAKIYYTLDNSMPSLTNGILYTKPIENITTNSVVKYLSIDRANNIEEIKTINLKFAFKKPKIISASIEDGGVLFDSKPTFEYKFLAYDNELVTSKIKVTLDAENITSDAAITQKSFIYIPSVNLSDGKHTLTIYLEDQAGNSVEKSYFFTIDSVIPKTTMNLDKSMFSSSQELILSLNKEGKIYATIDGTIPIPNSKSTFESNNILKITIAKDTIVKYFSVDNFGRKEIIQESEFKFDRTPVELLSTSINNNDLFNSKPTIFKLRLKEDKSKIDILNSIIKLDGYILNLQSNNANEYVYDISSYDIQEGIHSIDIEVFNSVGLKSTKTIQFSIDMTPPDINTTLKSGIYENQNNSDLKLDFNTNELNTKIYYTLDGSEPNIGDNNTFLYTGEKLNIYQTTTIKYIGVDKFGNISDIKSNDFKYIWNPPEINATVSTTLDGDIEISWISDKRAIAYNIYKIKLDDHWNNTSFIDDIQDWEEDENGTIMATSKVIQNNNFIGNNITKLTTLDNNVSSYIENNSSKENPYLYFIQAVGSNQELGKIKPNSWRDTFVSNASAITAISKSGGFYNSSIDLKLKSNTPALIYYTLDKTTPNENSNYFDNEGNLTIDSDTTIKYFSINKNNEKKESIKTQEYVFDYIKPVVQIQNIYNNLATNNKNISITTIYNDEKTGIDLVQSSYFINDVSYKELLIKNGFEHNITLKDGIYNLALNIYDKAGNLQQNLIKFSIDTVAPITTIEPNELYYNQDIVVSLNSEQNSTIYYTLDDYYTYY